MASMFKGRGRGWPVLLLVTMVAYTAWYGWQCGLNASVADVASQDLPHAWQTVWNVAHGHGFRYTDLLRQADLPRLSAHADYILFLFAPLSWLWSDYMLLVWVQTAVVASGAWALWRIARRWTKSDPVAFGLAVAYLLNGPLQFSVTFQFHAVTLAVAFILWMVEAMVARRRWWVIAIWLLLALMTKEQVGLIVGPLVCYLLYRTERRRLGLLLGGAAITWSLAQFLFIIPALRGASDPHLFWRFYYGTLGDTPREILPRLFQPSELTARLLTWGQLGRGVTLILPFALLPLLSPLTLLAVVAWLPHALGDSDAVWSLYYQNHALAIPMLALAAADGLRRLVESRHWPRWRFFVAGWALVAVVLGSVVFSPNRWSIVWRPVFRQGDPRSEQFAAIDRRIPSKAVISVAWGLPPTFRDHPTVYVLPAGISRAEYVVVGESALAEMRAYAPTYAADLRAYFEHSRAFTLVLRYDTVALYQRNFSVTPEPLPAEFRDPTLGKYWSNR